MPDRPQPPASRGNRRRHDPDRRERIIAACLEVIAEFGVAGTSHRKVAAAADVPLGSMTYHFSGMDELLHAAFGRFATSVSDGFDAMMAAAEGPEEAERIVVAIVDDTAAESHRFLVLTHELYTLAAREPAFRGLTNAWMARSRAALERHFDPATARMLDALIEGLTIHRALDTEPHDPAVAADAIRRITGLRT
ncbi:TetR family transcriptional regulator [Glycomyces sp. TRM65418]|uniref:TetR/AcrR family transcriptional regulator n=1 Tax=Glycomyces sp. TRM65418 TaxID=2867006 RepID=UPI001CE60CCA|nr:TetR family transcriptional regulator [Glycomyces sp. TRM65418]MCC3764233.1 TetR family transcriptional regulator [Glycomyces sp. TRM65418]QZD53916.1 TetR family transcriptional regulator [Glycomyces sp. TRM65418]